MACCACRISWASERRGGCPGCSGAWTGPTPRSRLAATWFARRWRESAMQLALVASGARRLRRYEVT